MGKIIIAILIACVCAGCSNRPILTQAQIFDLRTKCANIVSKQTWGYSDSVTPHYNPDTNRCYVETTTRVKMGDGDYVNLSSLYDAQSGVKIADGDSSCPEKYDGKLVGCDNKKIAALMQDDVQ